MSKPKSTDVLTDPEIQRHTQRILELQKEERQAQEEMGRKRSTPGLPEISCPHE